MKIPWRKDGRKKELETNVRKPIYMHTAIILVVILTSLKSILLTGLVFSRVYET